LPLNSLRRQHQRRTFPVECTQWRLPLDLVRERQIARHGAYRQKTRDNGFHDADVAWLATSTKIVVLYWKVCNWAILPRLPRVALADSALRSGAPNRRCCLKLNANGLQDFQDRVVARLRPGGERFLRAFSVKACFTRHM
jgi:hypothetical protein